MKLKNNGSVFLVKDEMISYITTKNVVFYGEGCYDPPVQLMVYYKDRGFSAIPFEKNTDEWYSTIIIEIDFKLGFFMAGDGVYINQDKTFIRLEINGDVHYFRMSCIKGLRYNIPDRRNKLGGIFIGIGDEEMRFLFPLHDDMIGSYLDSMKKVEEAWECTMQP